eukprot:scaffold48_cov311-Pinguiococcus_pyrenoidosus.AAC.210
MASAQIVTIADSTAAQPRVADFIVSGVTFSVKRAAKSRGYACECVRSRRTHLRFAHFEVSARTRARHEGGPYQMMTPTQPRAPLKIKQTEAPRRGSSEHFLPLDFTRSLPVAARSPCAVGWWDTGSTKAPPRPKWERVSYARDRASLAPVVKSG